MTDADDAGRPMSDLAIITLLSHPYSGQDRKLRANYGLAVARAPTRLKALLEEREAQRQEIEELRQELALLSNKAYALQTELTKMQLNAASMLCGKHGGLRP